MGIKFRLEIIHILASIFPNMTVKELIEIIKGTT